MAAKPAFSARHPGAYSLIPYLVGLAMLILEGFLQETNSPLTRPVGLVLMAIAVVWAILWAVYDARREPRVRSQVPRLSTELI